MLSPFKSFEFALKCFALVCHGSNNGLLTSDSFPEHKSKHKWFDNICDIISTFKSMPIKDG